MQCIVTCFFVGHNESYVGSIGSKLKHHNPPHRNITLEHLDEELIIAWNGPNIPHCDKLVKDTIDTMYGVGQWHFQRVSTASKLKFYVSKAVDSLQNNHSSILLDNY